MTRRDNGGEYREGIELGAFSIWHWVIVLLVLGIPILIIRMIVKKSSQSIAAPSPNIIGAEFRSCQTLGTIVVYFFVASIAADLSVLGQV